MKKCILFFLISLVSFATEIIDVKGDQATITPTTEKIGTSGIVIHSFDQNHSTIVARAILKSPDTIKLVTYDALAQESLPKPKILPKKGDSILLGYLYKRALIIAPNFDTYQMIKKRFSKEWIHPDLFAIELSKEKNPAPTKEDFHKFCNKYALSLVYIVLGKQIKEVDCYSFKPLHTFSYTTTSQKIKLPFYSRVKKIESSMFAFFGNSTIENYYRYYKNLLELR